MGKLDDGDPEILAVAMSEARVLKRLKVRWRIRLVTDRKGQGERQIRIFHKRIFLFNLTKSIDI